MADQTVLKKLEKDKKSQKKYTREWVNDIPNKDRLFSGANTKKIQPFLMDGKTQVKLVPNALRSITTCYQQNFLNAGMNEGRLDFENAGLSHLYNFWHMETAHAVMKAGLGANYKLTYREFPLVCSLLAIGWDRHADRLAHTLFDRWNNQERGARAISFEVLPDYFPWTCFKLWKLWKNSSRTFEFEPDIEQLGGYANMLQNLLNSDADVFTKALNEAADFHIMGQGLDDFDVVKKEQYWFFPIELLAACRIRQLRGLDMPSLSHPLFQATPMGQLQPVIPIPQDETLERLLPLYAKAVGPFELSV